MRSARSSPLCVVEIANERGIVLGGDRVGILEYNSIYGALGVNREMFAQWEDKHGVDSLGTAADGTMLAPGFPVLSKVAWTFIDPVILSSAELEHLPYELDAASSNTGSVSAREELEHIRRLALNATARGATLRFGPP